ncbi:MAG: sigma-54-dependent transcriptional regulator [Lutibacter sp.]
MVDANILIIDDNKSVLSALEILLQFEYKNVSTISNPNQISSYPNLNNIDIILLDMNFSAGVNTGNEGLFWLKEIKKKAPDTLIIMMTAYGGVDLAVKSLKEGATDFVLKPWNNEKLLHTLKSAYLLRTSKVEINNLKQKENNLKQLINQKRNLIVGNSKALSTVLSLTRKVAKTDVTVLITGENGTGKELIAQELHQLSNRKNEVFVSVDMGTISETLFESELFGHIKGSFTDAKEDRVGKFEAANDGTLFLDEIGNLSFQMQSKLLSVIQNREIVKVGSNKSIPVNIRLLCATNCNLNQMVADGLFREDLLYRINTIHIEVPNLRDREEDILVLAAFFLNKFALKYGKLGLEINNLALQKLKAYHWPGNIRELQHTLERAVILSEEKILKPTDFLLNASTSTNPDNYANISLVEMENIMITNALNRHNGNYTAAANELGITRQTLYNKMKNNN